MSAPIGITAAACLTPVGHDPARLLAALRGPGTGIQAVASRADRAPDVLAGCIEAAGDLDKRFIPATLRRRMTGIRIIPNTALHELAIAQGVIDRRDQLLDPAFYLAPPVAPLFPALARRLARAHHNWVFPGHGIRYDTDLAELLRRRGTRGPLWLSFAKQGGKADAEKPPAAKGRCPLESQEGKRQGRDG